MAHFDAVGESGIHPIFSWRKRGEGPRFSKPTERMVRYLRADVVAWLEENRA